MARRQVQEDEEASRGSEGRVWVQCWVVLVKEWQEVTAGGGQLARLQSQPQTPQQAHREM